MRKSKTPGIGLCVLSLGVRSQGAFGPNAETRASSSGLAVVSFAGRSPPPPPTPSSPYTGKRHETKGIARRI